MKNKIYAVLYCSIILTVLSSCRTYLTPVMPGNDMGYIPKAMIADSIKTLTHISASYAGSSSTDTKVNFELGMLNISRSHTFKEFNISYGVFGYAGKATSTLYNEENKSQEDYLPSFNKSISGAGIRFSTGLHETSANGNTDFRYLNFENSISFENGSYTDFRQEIYDSKIPKYVAVSNKKIIWTTGLSTEVIWRARRNHDFKHAFRLFMGGTPGLAKTFKYGDKILPNNRNVSSLGWMLSYYLYIKKFTLSLEGGKNTNWAGKTTLGYTL